jgi:4-azaleucine resistance transporter AzlC
MTTLETSPWRQAAAGALTIAPAAVAVVPFGLILGANAAEKGLSAFETATMSATVFAGSAQFLAIDLWTSPAAWAALAFATLLINLRHVLMGASLARRLGRFGPGTRWLAVFLMADEIWAVAEHRALQQPLTPAFYLGAALPLYANWVVTTTAGAMLGGLIEDPAAWGFDFAFTAVFIGLVAGFWRGRTTLVVACASAAGAILAHKFLPGAWYVVIGAGCGVTVAALLPQRAPGP